MKRSRTESIEADSESSHSELSKYPNSEYPGPSDTPEFTCSLHATPIVFASLESFESHYSTTHTWICDSCRCRFPSERFLALHLDEEHDPFVQIHRERGEKYLGCFEDNCDRKFADFKKRRLHLIDFHSYPKNFRFSIVTRGLRDGDVSLLKS